jgi:hypothetical protein
MDYIEIASGHPIYRSEFRIHPKPKASKDKTGTWRITLPPPAAGLQNTYSLSNLTGIAVKIFVYYFHYIAKQRKVPIYPTFFSLLVRDCGSKYFFDETVLSYIVRKIELEYT